MCLSSSYRHLIQLQILKCQFFGSVVRIHPEDDLSLQQLSNRVGIFSLLWVPISPPLEQKNPRIVHVRQVTFRKLKLYKMTLIMMFRLELITASSYMGAFPALYITHGMLALIQNGISLERILQCMVVTAPCTRESQHLEGNYEKWGKDLMMSFLMKEKGIA